MQRGAVTIVATALAASLATAPSVAHQRGRPSAAATSRTHYDVRLFAAGTTAYYNPDPIVVTKSSVLIAYQNATKPDGSGGSSTIVQYSLAGKYLRAKSLVGHCDGMRVNPYTGRLWVLLNNDANPLLYTLDANLGDAEKFTFSATPHGGGYDDLAFTGGKAFISASNPTLNAAGVNVYPAIDRVTLNGSTAQIAPVLYGNAKAVDYTTGNTVTLNEIDPDAMTVDPAGDVVLVNQAGSELVFLQHAGTRDQKAYRVPVGTQLDDTLFAYPTPGLLYVVDLAQNATYIVRAQYTAGAVYTVAPSDSGVASFLGTVDLKTGIVTPVVLGFTSPTGLAFGPFGR